MTISSSRKSHGPQASISPLSGVWWMRRLPERVNRKCLTTFVRYTPSRGDPGIHEGAIQERAGRTHERTSLEILAITGLLPHEHQRSGPRTLAEDPLGRIPVEVASPACVDRGFEPAETRGLRNERLGASLLGRSVPGAASRSLSRQSACKRCTIELAGTPFAFSERRTPKMK